MIKLGLLWLLTEQKRDFRVLARMTPIFAYTKLAMATPGYQRTAKA